MKALSIPWFNLFKYSVYLALSANVYFFWAEEMAASNHRFSQGYTLVELIDAFTSTIDTAAWVILLLLFELETYIISDEKLKGIVLWAINFVKVFCYGFVLYSFYGYWSGCWWLTGFESVAMSDLCQYVGESWMIALDEFQQISTANCMTLAQDNTYYKYATSGIYTCQTDLTAAYKLAIVDLINSLAWILIVVILEFDVWRQLRHNLTSRIDKVSTYVKNILYATLLFVAIYWGIYGQFIDFWDAFLWIVAFFFIELNIVEWQKEIEEEQ